MKFRIIGSLAIAAVSTLILSSCGGDPDSPGLEYMPDMYRSPAVEPYVDYGHIRETENTDLKMQMSALTPPSGTVPYFGTDSAEVMLMLPYKHKANQAFKATHGMYGEELAPEGVDTYLLAAEDKNPMALPADSVELAAFWSNTKKLFENNCSHCHGVKGDGNGAMMANGKYVGVPSYKDVMATEGQMFYSIYYGKGQMGSHRSILNKKEIWSIVHYIKKLQGGGSDEAAETEESGDAAVEAEAANADGAN